MLPIPINDIITSNPSPRKAIDIRFLAICDLRGDHGFQRAPIYWIRMWKTHIRFMAAFTLVSICRYSIVLSETTQRISHRFRNRTDHQRNATDRKFPVVAAFKMRYGGTKIILFSCEMYADDINVEKKSSTKKPLVMSKQEYVLWRNRKTLELLLLAGKSHLVAQSKYQSHRPKYTLYGSVWEQPTSAPD